MNLHMLDWIIVAGVLTFLTAVAYSTKKYTRSVADFLTANRCAGRYLVCVASGAGAFGAVSFVAMCEMYYSGGFSPFWWNMILLPATLITNLTGWVIYRFRQTRAMTLAQFFEMRYSKSFRVYAGAISFFSGILNFGIFPAVGARFFIYLCGLPIEINVGSVAIPTFAAIMFILLSVSLLFTFLGGQIAIIATDFFQGILGSITFILIIIFLFYMFPWANIVAGLSGAPLDKSMIHPMQTSGVKDFNIWYFLIAAFGYFYNVLSWQGAAAFNSSAKNAHEQRMASILGSWRNITVTTGVLLMSICAYVAMHHSAYASIAENVQGTLNSLAGNATVQRQMTVPIILSNILPVGIFGIFTAAMLAAFISLHSTYLHSWGSILMQDVILPYRKKQLSPVQHLWLLRGAMFIVAVFIFCFSLIFRQTQQIFMFFAITGAIFLGGAGAVIIGGLYWSRGTNTAAFFSLTTGSVLAVLALLIDQAWDKVLGMIHKVGEIFPFSNQFDFVANPWEKFPINGQWMYFIAMASAIAIYVVISLCGKTRFDMDWLLHRGKYAIDTEKTQSYGDVSRFRKALGIGKDFDRTDRLIYMSVLTWSLGWWAIFIIGTIYNLANRNVPSEQWAKFWVIVVLINFIVSVITTIWFVSGGLRDLKQMFTSLATMKRDSLDDGKVRKEPK